MNYRALCRGLEELEAKISYTFKGMTNNAALDKSNQTRSLRAERAVNFPCNALANMPNHMAFTCQQQQESYKLAEFN